MKIRTEMGLTFDDMLLMPKRSAIKSRNDVDTHSRFSRNIELHIPIISSNMDTVTEAPMAIAMAQAGGLGVIHRFMPIKKQAAEVTRAGTVRAFQAGTAPGIAGSPFNTGFCISVRQRLKPRRHKAR